MAFRTVVVTSHSKLEYSLSYLVHRTADQSKKILLDEVHTIIVDSTAVSITTGLLSECAKRKIKVIFCDEKHNPQSELMSYYGNSNSSRRIADQLKWRPEWNDAVWAKIVRQKIQNQSSFLKERGQQEFSGMLAQFAKEVGPGDSTNREGYAAKVYFNHAFFEGFTREQDCFLNACLNYGYTILLAEFNRAVVASGYITQIGIHHKNDFNDFNLSCDLIEPFRFLVDKKAVSVPEGGDFKSAMIDLLGANVFQLGKKQSLANAINIYCNSVFTALSNGNTESIAFLDYADPS